MMINEMKNSRSSDLLPMFYDCKYFSINNINKLTSEVTLSCTAQALLQP